MKNSPVALVLVLALGLALGLFAGATLFGSGPEGEADVAYAGARPAAAVPSASSAAPAADLRPAASGGEGGGAVDVGLSPADRRRAEAVAEQVQRTAATLDAAAAGEGAVTGRVETLDGDGLPGAVVRIAPREGDQPKDPDSVFEDADSKSLNEVLAEAAREALEDRRLRREARTDADGEFRFDGLPEGRWRISGFAEGYRLLPTTANYQSLPTGGQATFRAEPYHALEVSIVRTDGAPVDEAVIEASSSTGRTERSERFRWTPEQSTLHLPVNGYTLKAFADPLSTVVFGGDYAARWESEEQEVYLAGAGSDVVELTLAPADLLHGDVLFGPRFETSETLLLMTEAFSGEVPPEDDQLSRNDSNWLYSGRGYVLRGLEPGRYLLALAEGWRGPVIARSVVDYAGGIQREDLLVTRDEDLGQIELEVLAPEGGPVVGADLRLRVRVGRGSNTSRLNAMFRDGRYLFPTPQALADGLDEGAQVQVELRDERFAPATVELEPGVLAYTLQTVAPAHVAATVTGYADDALRARLRVEVSQVDDGSGGRRGGDAGGLDGTGRWTSDALQPGRYRVRLTLQSGGRSWGGSAIDEREVTLALGDNPVALRVPPLHDFTVLAPDQAEGTWFRLTALDEGTGGGGSSSSARVAEGRAEFSEVLAGRYRLSVNRSDGSAMEISVPCSDFTFLSLEPNAVEVDVSSDEGLLAAIGLIAGDLLVRIDGADMALPQLASQAGSLLGQTSGRHSAVVLRGGQEARIEWDGATVSGRSLGGRLTPVTIDR